MVELIGAVDLERYMGQWLEMARKPAFFQESCVTSYANYALEYDNGVPFVKVENICKKQNGEESKALGKAKIKGERKLAVRFNFFMNPFYRVNYEIIYIDKDYTRAIVGSPDKKYLWILSRENLPKEEIDTLLKIAKERGFDTSAIIFDVHCIK